MASSASLSAKPPVATQTGNNNIGPFILRNSLEMLLTRLQRSVPSSIIDRVAETVRLLETRIAVGRLGKADRRETREAAILEQTIRQQQQNHHDAKHDATTETDQAEHPSLARLEWNTLASAVGVKANQLQQLQQCLFNYLVPSTTTLSLASSSAIMPPPLPRWSVPVPSTQNGVGSDTSRYLSGGHANQPGRILSRRLRSGGGGSEEAAVIMMTTSRNGDGLSNGTVDGAVNMVDEGALLALSIRLGHFFLDPAAAARAAGKLLQQINTWYRPTLPSATDRRAFDYDLQRYWGAYQAAALLYVHHQQQQSHSQRSNRYAKKKPKKKRQKSQSRVDGDTIDHGDLMSILPDNDGEVDNGDGRDQGALTLPDLVEASSNCTYLELQQVWPNLKQMAETMERLQQEDQLKKQQHDARKRARQQPHSDQQAKASKRQTPLNSSDLMSGAELSETASSFPDSWTAPTPSWEAWKCHIVEQECERARVNLQLEQHGDNRNKSESEAPSRPTRRVVLARAAHDVLRKHGLVVGS